MGVNCSFSSGEVDEISVVEVTLRIDHRPIFKVVARNHGVHHFRHLLGEQPVPVHVEKASVVDGLRARKERIRGAHGQADVALGVERPNVHDSS